MTRYSVALNEEAENDLIDIWVNAVDRNAVTQAQAEIERRLGSDPKAYGNFVSEGLWRIDLPPLVAFYSIDDARSAVQVTNVDAIS